MVTHLIFKTREINKLLTSSKVTNNPSRVHAVFPRKS